MKFTAVSNLSGGALELVRYSGCEHRWVVREQIYVEVQMLRVATVSSSTGIVEFWVTKVFF